MDLVKGKDSCIWKKSWKKQMRNKPKVTNSWESQLPFLFLIILSLILIYLPGACTMLAWGIQKWQNRVSAFKYNVVREMWHVGINTIECEEAPQSCEAAPSSVEERHWGRLHWARELSIEPWRVWKYLLGWVKWGRWGRRTFQGREEYVQWLRGKIRRICAGKGYQLVWL